MEKANITRSSQVLQTANFVPSQNQSSYQSPVLTYTVPQGQVIEIPNQFIGLKLMCKETQSFTTGSGATTHTLTSTYPIVQDPSLNTSGGVFGVGTNVVVDITTPATGVVTTFTVTLPNTIALTGLAQNTSYVVNLYYYFAGGSATLVVKSSDGTAKTTVLTRSIANLNYIDDNDVRVGLKPAMTGLVIPEGYQIELEVNTAATICVYGSAETAYTSPNASESFIALPVQISSIFQWPTGIKAYAKGQYMGV